MSLLAIDAGTTGVTSLVVRDDLSVAGRGYAEFAQYFPADGWVEHDPDEIWSATLFAVQTAIATAASVGTEAPGAVGITNQRETVVLWDRDTLRAPRRAIVWQDRRTAGICAQLRSNGHEPWVAAGTGLRLDPYFSATKLSWVAHSEPALWEGVRAGNIAVGTVDSYLIARMTGGRLHVTDPTNASRTLLYDLTAATWSADLCDLFTVPEFALPTIVASYGAIGHTDPGCFAGLAIPITGVAGDQQAALFGQGCFTAGSIKCTYGTGSFVLVHTGATPVSSGAGMLTTVALGHPDGRRDFALEGAVFVTGAAVQWLRDGLGIIEQAAESESLARSVPDSGGLVFVPALTGLGAPDWDPQARGAIMGIGRGTTAAHLARATLEAIAFEVRDVVDAMTAESGITLPALAVDGGAAENDLLCQMQADELQIPVVRSPELQSTGLGAAMLAGLGSGVWGSPAELTRLLERHRGGVARFDPGPRDELGHRRWRAAVERTRGWTTLA